jgi:hypothetical protein
MPTWLKFATAAPIAGLLVLSTLPPIARAQVAAPPPAAKPDALNREGNIYDYRKHQPTGTPSEQSTKQVDDEVKALLKQTDELDRQFKDAPARP